MGDPENRTKSLQTLPTVVDTNLILLNYHYLSFNCGLLLSTPVSYFTDVPKIVTLSTDRLGPTNLAAQIR